MTINFKTPDIKELKPRILVLGVGGAGGNDYGMIDNRLQGVEFSCKYRCSRSKIK